MRATLTLLALVAGLSCLATVPVAAATRSPTPAQIRTAVRAAERSKNLWATVNVCDTKRYPGAIGIRGQMPALGFKAWLSMRIQLVYYDGTRKRYVPIPGSAGRKLVRLGHSSTGLQQDGALFQFSPHQPSLRATVQFFWRRAGRLLGQVTLTTTGGHRSADFGSPAHFSARQCKIP